VKILGELVDPVAIQHELAVPEISVIALPDERKGHRLVAVFEKASISKRVESRVDAYNQRVAGFLKIDGVALIDVIPRSDLGKVRRLELAGLVEGLGI
jgi:acyl-CoA synthetase (AMP-forming)/AMP-acid ligase II